MKQNDLLSEHTGIERYLFIISVGLVVALLVTSTASATGSETTSIGSATVNPGETVVLPITIADVTDVTGVDVTIVYDANIVIIRNVVANSSVSGSSVSPNIENDVGKTTITYTNIDYVTATSAVPIIDITFEVVGSSGSSTLELHEVEFGDASFNVYTPDMANNGEIAIAGSNNALVADSEIKDDTRVASSVQSDSTNDKSNGDEDAAARYASTSSQADTQNKDTDEISSAIDQPEPATPGFGWFLTVLDLLFITNIYRKKNEMYLLNKINGVIKDV